MFVCIVAEPKTLSMIHDLYNGIGMLWCASVTGHGATVKKKKKNCNSHERYSRFGGFVAIEPYLRFVGTNCIRFENNKNHTDCVCVCVSCFAGCLFNLQHDTQQIKTRTHQTPS